MNKQIIWALALVAVATSAGAQTREATQEWILHQSGMNPPNLSHHIEGGELVSEVSLGPGAAALGAAPVRKAVEIGKVTRITYVHTDRYLSYTLACDVPCAYVLDEPDRLGNKFLFEIYRKLDANYPARMGKALQHLVKLHGGTAAVVREQAPKEAF